VLPLRNRRITAFERAIYRRFPLVQRLVRELVYWSRELFATALVRNSKSLDRIEAMGRRQLKQVRDPELRAKLTPDFRPGCKRLLMSNDYYPSLQQPNVEVIAEKIVEVLPHAVVTGDGVEHAVDTIILGTGFRVTDNPMSDRVIGADGSSLGQRWREHGAQAYLGTTMAGFPNLFLMAGPNTGIGHTSLVVMMEAQLAYIIDALRVMDARGAASVDLRPEAMRAWTEEIQRKAAGTVWNSGGCASWYLDAEGRNTTIWPDHTFRYARRTRRFDLANYRLEAHAAAPERV